jgi:hypothetical protein
MSKRLNGILLIILVLTMLLGANNFVFAEDSGKMEIPETRKEL